MIAALVVLLSILVVVTSLASPKNVLIIQNKGGGHGEIGMHTCHHHAFNELPQQLAHDFFYLKVSLLQRL
jgi:hypothetical protein